MSSPDLGPVLIGLFDGAHHDPVLADRMMFDLISPRRDACLARLQAAVDRGELDAGTDLVILLEQLYGPLYYRLLITREAISQDYLRRQLAALLREPQLLARDARR